MDIPTAILYSVLSTVARMALEPGEEPQPSLEISAVARSLPPEAKRGLMQPPAGDGFLNIGGRQWPLSPAAQFRNQNNLLVVPVQIQNPVEVVYLTDASGAVFRVWMLSSYEAAAITR